MESPYQRKCLYLMIINYFKKIKKMKSNKFKVTISKVK